MAAKLDKAIIDADFALKIGSINFCKILQDVLPLCVDILFVHEHVYNNEILFPPAVKAQIDALIDSGRAVVVSRSYVVAQKPEALIIYDEIQLKMLPFVNERKFCQFAKSLKVDQRHCPKIWGIDVG